MGGKKKKVPTPEPETPPQEEQEPPPPPPMIYGRLVYVIPYRSPELVQKIQDLQVQISCETLNLEVHSRSALSSRKLTQEELEDPYLDILTGFVLIDAESRIYVIEGIAEGGIKRMMEGIPLAEPNTPSSKFLMNSQVIWDTRYYLSFGPDLRRIKLRGKLSKILMKPDLYVKQKVSEELMNTLHTLMEIKRCERLKFIKEFNLSPDPEQLDLLERKYGDALTREDITGKPAKARVKLQDLTRRSSQNEPEITTQGTTTLPREEETQKAPKKQKQKHKLPLDCKNPKYSALLRTKEPPKDFSKLHRQKIKQDSEVSKSNKPLEYVRMEPENEEYYIYSGQKLNYTEVMKQKISAEMQADPSKFYASSDKFLSLQWPVVDPDELQLRERQKFNNTRLRYK